jgi:hypothetical protein
MLTVHGSREFVMTRSYWNHILPQVLTRFQIVRGHDKRVWGARDITQSAATTYCAP